MDMNELIDRAARVQLIIIGVDGVLTDAGMYFDSQGDMLRKFNRRDGLGIQLLKRYDVKSAVLSSMGSAIVKRWAEMFQVDFIRLGVDHKLHEFEKLQIRCGLEMDEISYISDDIDEIEILDMVGLGITVADGMAINKRHSAYVTKLKGGEGAVREAIELILSSKQKKMQT
jgi:3-deoxy-D-manno-octulosonate 8-phosphate phosphatase (KDO 8-P phosphatase)